MNNKCYLICGSYWLGEIEECEITKETEKTFEINRKGWGKSTIKKSEMSCYSGDIRLTYHGALSRLEEMINFRMANNKAKIEKLREENISLTEKLVKVQAEIEVTENDKR